MTLDQQLNKINNCRMLQVVLFRVITDKREIIAVIDETFAVAKIKLEKIQPCQNSIPWLLQHRCGALPTELSSQLGASHWRSWFVMSPRRHDDDKKLNKWELNWSKLRVKNEMKEDDHSSRRNVQTRYFYCCCFLNFDI